MTLRSDRQAAREALRVKLHDQHIRVAERLLLINITAYGYIIHVAPVTLHEAGRPPRTVTAICYVPMEMV